MTRPSDAAVERRRMLLVFAVVLALGALVVALVLPAGRRIVPAPQAPPVGAVSGAATSCLGQRVAFVQSGVYVDLHVPGRSSGPIGEEVGRRIAGGEIGRESGRGTLRGTCAPGTERAGAPLGFTARFAPSDEADVTVVGTVRVGGDRLAAEIVEVDASAPAVDTEPALDPSELVARLFLAVAIVIAAARLMGGLFGRLRQPRVVGEIVAGILLGPSLLGLWFPSATEYLFPPDVTGVMRAMAQFGLIFFMFLIGLELDLRMIRASSRAAALISQVGLIVPLALGVVVALVLYPRFAAGSFTGFALFMGAAMSITAFPVLARILTDTGLHRTRLGATAITCAAVGDVTAWCVLAIVVAIVNTSGAGDAVSTIALAAVYVALMIAAVRPVVARLARVHEARGRLNPPVMAGILVFVLLSAWVTEEIGIHAIFGAFLAGAVMPRSRLLAREITEKLEDVTVLLLLPIFFAAVGLSTRFSLIGVRDLWAVALIIAVAMAGKWGGTTLAARSAGQPWRFSVGLGVLMNARGLTEIVILTVGRSLGVISPALFTMMVLMALVTTFMATPLLSWLYPRRLVDSEVVRAAAAERLREPGAGYRRVLVAVGDPTTAGPLVDVVAGLRSADGAPLEVVLAHVVPPPGREEIRANLAGLEEAADIARAELLPLQRRLGRHDVPATVAAAVGDPGSEVRTLAAEHGADLLLVGAHRAYLGDNPLGGVAGGLLDSAPVDVAVLVERPDDGSTSSDRPIGIWFDGSLRDLAALEVAALAARGRDVPLRVVHLPGVAIPEVVAAVEPVTVTDREPATVLGALDDVQLAVVGLGGATEGGIGRLRARILEAAPAPVLVVHGRHTRVAPSPTNYGGRVLAD